MVGYPRASATKRLYVPSLIILFFTLLEHTARLSKRTRMVRELVGEVVGMAPYEKRLLDMLKTGGASSEKRMYKFAKRRLGTHKRAQKKRDQVKELHSKMRAKA